MIRVLIVEDQRMTRERMEDYVNSDSRYYLVGSISNAALAEMRCMQNEIDLILMDVYTEQGESGLVATAKIKKRFPNIKIIIVTSMVECSFLHRAKEAGAESFWYKDFGQQELLDVMERTMKGESIYPEQTPEVQIGFASSYEFTKEELEILRLLVNAMPNAEIAKHLGISVSAVRIHIANMLKKTGYTSKTKLAVAVSNKKLIIPDPDSGE